MGNRVSNLFEASSDHLASVVKRQKWNKIDITYAKKRFFCKYIFCLRSFKGLFKNLSLISLCRKTILWKFTCVCFFSQWMSVYLGDIQSCKWQVNARKHSLFSLGIPPVTQLVKSTGIKKTNQDVDFHSAWPSAGWVKIYNVKVLDVWLSFGTF